MWPIDLTMNANTSNPDTMGTKAPFNRTRVLLILAVLLLSYTRGFSQQDPMYNQYIFNAYTINAAEAGTRNFGTVSMLYRWQWVGLDGAPSTGSVGVESPVGKGWGIGFNMVNDRIGPAMNQTINLSGAYHLNLNEDYRLSLGLNMVGNNQRVNFERFKYLTDFDDPVLTNNISSFNPNVGGGLLLYSDRNFFGASMPRFIEYKLTNSNLVSLDQLRHIFLYGGHIFNLSNRVTFKPSVLAKIVKGAPAEFDINAVISLHDVIGLGVNYRSGDGVGLLMGITVLERVQFNYAYELPVTDVRFVTIQTHEVGIRYIFGDSHFEKIRSPRFFN